MRWTKALFDIPCVDRRISLSKPRQRNQYGWQRRQTFETIIIVCCVLSLNRIFLFYSSHLGRIIKTASRARVRLNGNLEWRGGAETHAACCSLFGPFISNRERGVGSGKGRGNKYVRQYSGKIGKKRLARAGGWSTQFIPRWRCLRGWLSRCSIWRQHLPKDSLTCILHIYDWDWVTFQQPLHFHDS